MLDHRHNRMTALAACIAIAGTGQAIIQCNGRTNQFKMGMVAMHRIA